MYCRMIRGCYLRANGEMACYCGPGEEVTLAKLPVAEGDFDFIQDGYRNPAHRGVGERMRQGLLPYPAICLKCIYLEPLRDPGSDDEQEIEWMHVEATSQCNLNCGFCIPQKERATFREPPLYLPREAFARIVEDIARRGMRVKWMYFSGRGEPGLHPDLWEMVAMAKKRLGTDFLVNTNGNIAFDPLIVDSGLDKIKIAVDGATDDIYRRYRKGGSLDRVLNLTRSIAERKKALGCENPRIIWQYILFSHNDGDEHIAALQRLAMDCGVDEVLIKSTFTSGYSSRTLEGISRLHPALRTLDLQAMIQSKSEDLAGRISAMDAAMKAGNLDQALPLGLDAAKSIFRHFVLGIERKMSYNEYGSNGDIECMERLTSQHPEEFGEQMRMLAPLARRIASVYDAQGRGWAGEYYEKLARRLESRELTAGS